MRILNRPLAFLLAVALLAASVILIIEVVAVLVHARPVVLDWHTWYRWAERTEWKRGVIRVWAVVLIVLGLLLLALQLKRRRPSRLAITADNESTDAAMTRRGLRDAARNAATSVDGVSSAAVTVTRRKLTINAAAAAHDRSAANALTDPVTQAVQTSLGSLQLRTPPNVSVRMRTRSE